jgi:hypothetical protein
MMEKEFTLKEAKEIIDYALTKFYVHDQALVQYPDIKNAVSENCMLFSNRLVYARICAKQQAI